MRAFSSMRRRDLPRVAESTSPRSLLLLWTCFRARLSSARSAAARFKDPLLCFEKMSDFGFLEGGWGPRVEVELESCEMSEESWDANARLEDVVSLDWAFWRRCP